MNEKPQIPVDAEVAIQSVRWVIQSRAHETDPWHTENSNTPGLSGEFEEAARKLLKLYRTAYPHRESRRIRRTIACFDEPIAD